MLIRIQWDNLMKKVNIYIHTWKVNNWREILNEQLSHIDDSGLGDTASVHICNLDFECKTQLDMWEHSKINDSYYLYLHNLGISWQGTKYEDLTANWRKWIMNGVVGNWKEYVSHLDEYDVVGDNWKEESYWRDWHPDKEKYKDSDLTYPKHFAPQMFWTKSSYLSKLEHPHEYEKSALPDEESIRTLMEGWTTSGDGKFKEVRKDFSLEPVEAYNNRKKENPFYSDSDGGRWKILKD